ncbi:hypothetical protein K2E96_02005 [Pseudomonas sp. ERGC3:05]|nr:hypothetical protein [Pseudomonas sp. ERGC3:01]QZC97106.1 hypothetical protein K2E96_02005 [Pseudomonas sp. ERGC3:05]
MAGVGASIQSQNYVPGVSGWKLDKDGSFEINSCTLGSAAQAPERQMVSVEVASWSKYDLPKNAANLLQFMQAELQKVPEEYRHAAEFEEFDASYGDESFNSRLFLGYTRLETEEELADRLAKAKVAGTRVSIKNGLLTITHDGVVRIKLGNLDQPEQPQPQPFLVDGDRFCISKALIDDGSITNAKITEKSRVSCMCGGGYTGDGPKPGDAPKAGGASAMLARLTSKIEETKLGQDLKDQVEKLTAAQADQVKEIIRAELRQGGLLWRRG